MSSLLYSPTPTTNPAHSHHRSCWRIRARMMNSSTGSQTASSMLVVSSTWPNTSGNAANAYAHALSVCAPRPPPTSRVMPATTSTDTAAASVAHTRSAQTSSASRSRLIRASRGVSGGWSR